MPQPEPAQRLVEGREPGDDAETVLELGFELRARDVGRRLDQPLEIGCGRRQQRPAAPAVAGRRGAAGRAQPLHQT
jgi:hypothetical protein